MAPIPRLRSRRNRIPRRIARISANVELPIANSPVQLPTAHLPEEAVQSVDIEADHQPMEVDSNVVSSTENTDNHDEPVNMIYVSNQDFAN